MISLPEIFIYPRELQAARNIDMDTENPNGRPTLRISMLGNRLGTTKKIFKQLVKCLAFIHEKPVGVHESS
jgi:hypothetical protein